MALEKITEAQMDATGVCAAPDILNGTPAQNKAVFDRMVRGLVAPAYNACVDVVNELQNVENGVVAAEADRAEAEAARQEAEIRRENAETGYVAQAKENALRAKYEATVAQYGRLEFSRSGVTRTIYGGSYDNPRNEGDTPGLPEKAHSLEIGREYLIWVYRPDEGTATTEKIVYDGGTVEIRGLEIRGRISYTSNAWEFYVRNTENTEANYRITATNNEPFPAAETSANNAADSETNAKWYAERAEYACEYTLEKKQQTEEYAIQAIGASNLAKNHADRAEAARESIVVDEQKLEETAKSAEANALAAGSAASAAADHAATTARIAASVEETKNSAMGYAHEAANSAQESSQNAQMAEDAANRAEPAAHRAEAAAERAEAAVPSGQLMSSVDPVGTGSFSLNRRSDSTVGTESFAEGYNCIASGVRSHAEGDGTTANGHISHAEGTVTHAAGYASHAEGEATTASGMYQHVQGKYNVADTTSAHIVGNGTSYSNFSNAHTLDWDGNAWFAGDVYVGSTGGKNKDEGSKRLATVDEIPAAAVLYTPQTLTDEQKSQARANLGVTPEIFVAVRGETLLKDIVKASEEGKVVAFQKSPYHWAYLERATTSEGAYFTEVDGHSRIIGAVILRPDNTWVYTSSSFVMPSEVEAKGIISYKPQTLTESQKAQARENIGAVKEFDYAAYGLPILKLTGDVSAMTKDNAVDLAYEYGDRSGTASVKWQGSSSIAWEKKNYTIKFDNAFEAVEGWGEQKKYCLKANFIDHSHARNVVSAKLWGKVAKSRTTANDKLNALPNAGAIDGLPCIIELNGEFHGLYTFNIPKDGWMFGMDDSPAETETEYQGYEYISANGIPNQTTFAYTTQTAVSGYQVRKRSTLSGGRAYWEFDANKITDIPITGYLFDENGAPYKVFQSTTPDQSGSLRVAGDYDASVWVDPATAIPNAQTPKYNYVDAPFSVEIPDGCTVMWFMVVSNAKLPDGTLTHTWSSAAESAGIWSMKWAHTGIQTYVVSGDKREAIFCADTTSQATRFLTEATLNGDFDLEYATDEDNASWALTSLNRLIRACLDSDGTDLDTTLANYLDWNSAIDYYIYTCLLGGADMAGKNYLLATYDGTKWFFSAYDMDSTFGLWWNGQHFLRENHYPTVQWYANYHTAMKLILNHKKDALKTRYAELRAGALSEGAVAEAFSNFVAKMPTAILDEDVRKWPTIPSTAASNLAQILNWYRMRVAVIDKEMETL